MTVHLPSCSTESSVTTKYEVYCGFRAYVSENQKTKKFPKAGTNGRRGALRYPPGLLAQPPAVPRCVLHSPSSAFSSHWWVCSSETATWQRDKKISSEIIVLGSHLLLSSLRLHSLQLQIDYRFPSAWNLCRSRRKTSWSIRITLILVKSFSHEAKFCVLGQEACSAVLISP